jgi:alpha-ketoglutarate-dependent taurine dioxygenase
MAGFRMSQISLLKVVDDGSAVQVPFYESLKQLLEQGHTDDSSCDCILSYFHAPWLWLNDPAHLHPFSGQRTRSLSGYYSGWKIRTCEIVESSPFTRPPPGSLHSTAAHIFHSETAMMTPSNNGNDNSSNDNVDTEGFLLVHWSNETTGEEQQSFYPMRWLFHCRYDDAALDQRQSASVVTPQHAISHSRPPKELDMNDIWACMSKPQGQDEGLALEVLHAIVQDGAVLIRNAPSSLLEEEEQRKEASQHIGLHTVERLAHWLAGGISHGQLYGDTFHVTTQMNANNIAYTSESLVPHQDLAYYESQPGLQLLHCVSNSVETVVGGASTLIDIMAAATELQCLAPDLFHTLTTVEATFVKQRNNADIVYRGPHITVDSCQTVVAARWSPPFEGPLFAKSERVEDYFIAKCAFELMLDNSIPQELNIEPLDKDLQQALRNYASNHTWVRRLCAGDVLVFNNQRLLHGRRSFRLTEDARDGDRHLIGCYANMEETLNRYRLLRRSTLVDGAPTFHRNMGNSSSGT